ncbi:MerR family transcriptional regulator [Enterococcus devriesei]|uniref:MerR family transcriptional regulator n=1 Tax=Enterococcus devriesei TaxID=319970 RepID=UPI001C0FFD31|nr:MerR family transcriptional regulator [Enterococcus devriesei]MBU5365995.1 MerR family transcriptional regulator [Enterococcus devriesei]
MNYTIKQMAEMSGVSARTLRFYDERSLLKPAFLSEAGYRIYTEKEIDRLQQILLYRSLGLPLRTIKEMVDRPDEKIQATLIEQKVQLKQKRQELDQLLNVLEDTLRYYQGEINMTNEEKFQTFKAEKLAENEAQYGTEIREHYGTEAVAASNEKWQGMREADYQKMQGIKAELLEKLSDYLATPNQQLGKEIAALHKAWLLFSWKEYSSAAHKGLSEMYLADERFTRYYDEKSGIGATEALYQIIQRYA